MKPELYEKLYEFEWNHRSYLLSAQNLPIGVMSIVGGALILLLQRFSYTKSIATSFFVIFTVISIATLCFAIFFLFKSLIGYKYKRIPTPLEFEKHYKDLLDWWVTYGNGGEKEATNDIDIFVNQRIAEATEVNATNNQLKSQYLHKTNIFLAISFLFLVFAAIPYTSEAIQKDPTVYKVKLIQSETIEKEIPQMTNKESSPKEESPQKIKTTPPKPSGPPNKDIRENVNPREIRKK